MCYKPTIHIHNCQHPPLLPVLIQLFFVLLVPELMGVSVQWAKQYVCTSTCVQMELLHMTDITHLLLPPTLSLHIKVKIGTYTYLQSFLQFNLCMYMHKTSLMHQPYSPQAYYCAIAFACPCNSWNSTYVCTWPVSHTSPYIFSASLIFVQLSLICLPRINHRMSGVQD